MKKEVDTQVVIQDQVLTLRSDLGEEHINKVANYVDQKMRSPKIKKKYNNPKMKNMPNILLGISIVDELFKEIYKKDDEIEQLKNNFNAETNQLKSSLNTDIEQLKLNLTAQIKKCKKEINHKEKEIINYMETISLKDDQIAKTEEEVIHKSRDILIKDNQIKDLIKVKDEYKKAKFDLEKANEQYKNQIKQYQDEIELLLSENKKLKESIPHTFKARRK